MHNPRTLRSLLVALTAMLALSLSLSSSSSADTRSVRATGVKDGSLVFKPRGVRATNIDGAHLRVGRTERRLRVRSVRRGVRRGAVTVRAPHRLRRRVRRLEEKAQVRLELAIDVKQPATTEGMPTGPGQCPLPAGSKVVSPSGADSNPGTAGSPWRTLERAEAAAAPGTTIALRGGTYGARGEITYLDKNGSGAAPISIIAYPGEVPTIAGHMAVSGDHRRLCGLLFEGATGPVARPAANNPGREQVKLLASGDGFELVNSEVRGSQWHAGVYLEGVEGARIVGNFIHDNGRFDDPSHANNDHGVYVYSGSGLIEGNNFEHNYSHAVQLYPHADGVRVRRNRMTGHGRSAVIVAEHAANNVIEGNDIFGNRRGIQAWSLWGKGNVARNNRLRDNDDGDFEGKGLSLRNNLVS